MNYVDEFARRNRIARSQLHGKLGTNVLGRKINMAAEMRLVKHLSGKRKANEERLFMWQKECDTRAKRCFNDELTDKMELAHAAALAVILLTRKPRKDRGCDEHRSSTWWSEGYRT
jgi:hypothetical protein